MKLKNDLCLFFCHVTIVLALRVELLTFQEDDEPLGRTWGIFMQLVNSGPPHGILDEMQMQ